MSGSSRAPRILVVDDEPSLRAMVLEYLSEQGFAVSGAENGEAMRVACDQQRPDLVLMDLRLPGEDGVALTRYLRNRYRDEIGIIMLTANAETVDRIIGLEMGADDYVVKPFDLRELLARVRSVLRRALTSDTNTPRPVDTDDRIRFGHCLLDLASRELTGADRQPIAITNQEFNLLRTFADNPDRTLSRDYLMTAAYGRDWNPDDRSIDTRIARLRKKIEADPRNPKVLTTVYALGYLFVSQTDNEPRTQEAGRK